MWWILPDDYGLFDFLVRLVLESENSYIGSNISAKLCSKIHVQNSLINEHNLEFIKQSVFNYGAVTIIYIHNDAFYNYNYHSYYMDNRENGTGHMVSIVGWDDNF